MNTGTSSHASALSKEYFESESHNRDESLLMLSGEEELECLRVHSCIAFIGDRDRYSSPQSEKRSSLSSPDALRENIAPGRKSLDIRTAELEEKFRKAFSQSMKVSRRTSKSWARRASSGSLLSTSSGGGKLRPVVRGWACCGCLKHPEGESAKQVSPLSAWTKGRNTVAFSSMRRKHSMSDSHCSADESHGHLSETSGGWSPCNSSRSGVDIELAEANVVSGPYFKSKHRGERSVLLIPLNSGDSVDTILVVVSMLMLVVGCGAFWLQSMSLSA